MFKRVLEKAEEPDIKRQHPLDHRKSNRVPEKHLFLLYWLRQSFCVDHITLWKILQEMGIQPITFGKNYTVILTLTLSHVENSLEYWKQKQNKTKMPFDHICRCHLRTLAYSKGTCHFKYHVVGNPVYGKSWNEFFHLILIQWPQRTWSINALKWWINRSLKHTRL